MADKQIVGLGDKSDDGKVVDRADSTKLIYGSEVDKNFHSTVLSQSFWRYVSPCLHEPK